MQLLVSAGAAALLSLLLTLLLFEPVFGIKFTKHRWPLSILYSATSGIAALIGIFIGGMLAIMAVWAAIGGGASMGLLYCAFLIPVAVAILANFSILQGFKRICPNCYEQKSNRGALMAAAVVVFCQGGVVYLLQQNIRQGHDGLRKFDVPIWQKEIRPLFGYIDKSGKFVIKPQFAEAEKFHNGKAVVWPEGSEPDFRDAYLALNSYPLIDKGGNKIGTISEAEHAKLREDNRYENPEDYEESHNGNSSFAILARKSGWQEGEGNHSDIADRVFSGLATKSKGEFYIYVDKYGKRVLDKQFLDAQRFSEGLAAVEVRQNGKVKWGYVTRDGAWAIRPCFDKASPFHDGLAAVGIINPEQDSRYQSLNCNQYRFGYIDKTGKFVIPPIFMHAYSFSEGLAAARIDVSAPPKEGQGNNLVELLDSEQKELADKQGKEMDGYMALCLKSWRDANAWGESAYGATAALDKVQDMERDGVKRERILALQAVIDTIAYPVKTKEAEKLAQEVITINSKNALAHGVLGHCLALRGENAKAIQEFAIAQKLEPSPEWLAQTGLAYEDLNKPDLAIAEFSKMIEASPRDPWGYGSRAHAYLDKMEFKKGLADAETALHLDPKNVFALKQLASVAIYYNQYQKAIDYLNSAEAALNPKSVELVEVLDMHAKAEDGLGHKKEAEALRKRSKALYP